MEDKAMKEKDEIFRQIQEYLKPCPVIIWGSGATIDYGMPSMEELKKVLDIEETGNLEDILSNFNKKQRKKYEYRICKEMLERDKKVRQRFSSDEMHCFGSLKKMIDFCLTAHPCKLDIITTNYDCVLEYFLSWYEYKFSDGFSGRQFSKFDENNFKDNKHINLYKVHGSLRWENNKYSYFNKSMDIIFPDRNKYKRAHAEPFRTIIQRADNAISNSESFLCTGFGFNDEHLTPKLEQAMRNDRKIVIIVKKATDKIREKIGQAKKFVLIEGSNDGKTKFTTVKGELDIDGNYWKLDDFIKVIGG